MSRTTAEIDPQTLVRFGLWNQWNVTHVGTMQPARSADLSDFAYFVPLCNRASHTLWDRRELENSARTAKRPCKACERKAAAIRHAWERAGREG
jgi:hypothetical protein